MRGLEVEVKAMVFMLLALLLADEIPASEQPISYQEATAASELQLQDPILREWAERVLAPFLEKELAGLVEPCLPSVSETERSTARIVVILDGDKVVTTFDPEASAGFSICLADKLRTWSWPAPPTRLIYVPVELNVTPPDPLYEEADEHVILKIIGSKQSPEPDREK